MHGQTPSAYGFGFASQTPCAPTGKENKTVGEWSVGATLCGRPQIIDGK